MNFEYASEDPSARLLNLQDQAADSASGRISVVYSVKPRRFENYPREGEYSGEEHQGESEEDYEDDLLDEKEEQTEAAISEGVEDPERARNEDRDGGSSEDKEYAEHYVEYDWDLPPLSLPPPDYQSDVGSIFGALLARSRQDHTPNP